MFVFNLEIMAGWFKKSGYFPDRNKKQIKLLLQPELLLWEEVKVQFEFNVEF